jgi:hypothetical protein
MRKVGRSIETSPGLARSRSARARNGSSSPVEASRRVGVLGGPVRVTVDDGLAGGAHSSLAVGSRVAVSGGAEDGFGPVVLELMLELADVFDALLVGSLELSDGGLLVHKKVVSAPRVFNDPPSESGGVRDPLVEQALHDPGCGPIVFGK